MKTTMTVAELWREFGLAKSKELKPKTFVEYERLYERLIKPEYADTRISALEPAGVERWHRSLAKATPYQANRALALLSSMLTMAVRWRAINYNAARGIRRAKEQGRETVLNARQRQRLFDALMKEPLTSAIYFIVLFYTGARPSEIRNARWEWLHEDVIQLPDSKTGKRTIFLPEKALRALQSLPTKAPEGRMFPENVCMQSAWLRVRRRAGLKGVRLYDLRHTFASAGLEAGLSLALIGELLGHRNANTTKRYAHLDTKTGLDSVAKVAGRLG